MMKPHKTSSARRRVPFLPPRAAAASENTAAANASSVSADRPEPANGRRGLSRYADPPAERRAAYLATHAWLKREGDEA
jgi:hypothetical protein